MNGSVNLFYVGLPFSMINCQLTITPLYTSNSTDSSDTPVIFHFSFVM